jgi:uncharacterized alkaline shock family protein YloU
VSVTASDIAPTERDVPAPRPAQRGPSGTSMPAHRSELFTEQGRTSIADSVVAKIAGLACREISGVHDMGGGATRAFGAIKEKLPIGSSQPSASQGVSVEVGERQAAIDLDIVVEYGGAIVDIAESIRRNVIGKVEAMTGLEVTEVNVTVDDVFLGEAGNEEPRVQ